MVDVKVKDKIYDKLLDEDALLIITLQELKEQIGVLVSRLK